jgi:uncharacterized damage-inducible protein DinB
VTWTAPSSDSVDGPMVGDDRAILAGYLAWQRSTLFNICAGLTAEQLAIRPVPPSNLSLLGLLRHLAKVERTWFRIRIAGEVIDPIYDPALGQDYDFEAIEAADAESAVARLAEEIRLADTAVADVSFDHTIEVRGETMSVRMVYLHMCGEYARHNGHADLLRETIDGVTGR